MSGRLSFQPVLDGSSVVVLAWCRLCVPCRLFETRARADHTIDETSIRLKNIEETERAKRAMMENRNRNRGQGGGGYQKRNEADESFAAARCESLRLSPYLPSSYIQGCLGSLTSPISNSAPV